MESPFYEYGYICTACVEDLLSTKIIEDFLSHRIELVHKEGGVYYAQDNSIQIGLMKVRDRDSWSSFDYDEINTNYISFVITKSKKYLFVELIDELSNLLQLPYRQDDE